MIGTGKYDFPGIRKAGTAALKAVVATTGWGAWLIASPFNSVFEVAAGWLSEWLANRGLLIINLGAIYVSGEIDQARFDKAFEEALEKVKLPGLTDEQKKGIDDEVIEAFRWFGRIGNKPPKS